LPFCIPSSPSSARAQLPELDNPGPKAFGSAMICHPPRRVNRPIKSAYLTNQNWRCLRRTVRIDPEWTRRIPTGSRL
jgi:hypothetical protein